jgi:hypothetical protein
MDAEQEPIQLLTALLVAGSRNAMLLGWLMRFLTSFIAGARELEGDEHSKA